MWRHVENPLLIPLIVSKTLKQCDRTTLLKCRLVCQLWEDEVKKIITFKNSPIFLTDFKGNSKCVLFGSHNYLVLDEDVDNVSRLKDILQATQIIIQYLEIQCGQYSFSQFVEILKCFPKLENLVLSENFILPKITNDFVDEERHVHGKLKSIHFNLRDEYLQNLANFAFLLEFPKLVPNLQVIRCHSVPFPIPGDHYTTLFSKMLFNSIMDSLSNMISPTLSQLDINVDFRNDDLILLKNAKLPLKSLHLPIDSIVSSEIIGELLDSLANTLKSLKLTYKNCFPKELKVKNLVNLKNLAIHEIGSENLGIDNKARYRRRSSFGIGFGPTLELRRNTCDCDLFKYSAIDLDFDRTMFHIFNSESTACASLFNAETSGVLPKLIKLHINSMHYIPRNIYKLKESFPNLCYIRVSYLDDTMLRSLIRNFPQLESLSATEGFFTDAGLVGISQEVYEILGNIPTDQNFKCDYLREFPSFNDLKQLRYLHLSSPRVTDFGVIHGIITVISNVHDIVLDFPQMRDSSLIGLTKAADWDTLILKSGSFSDELINDLKIVFNGRFNYTLEN